MATRRSTGDGSIAFSRLRKSPHVSHPPIGAFGTPTRHAAAERNLSAVWDRFGGCSSNPCMKVEGTTVTSVSERRLLSRGSAA